MDPKTPNPKLASAAKRFLAESIDVHGGADPVGALYTERRAGWSLFAKGLSDADCEALRPYLFGRPIPRKAGDAPVVCLNLVDGEWKRPAEVVPMKSLADRRITLMEIARSSAADVEHCLARAQAFWTSLEWSREGLAYRKYVIKNFSRLLEYFYEECLDELRQQTPKTRLEADKDFWEAKRAADHLEGNAEKAMAGDWIPTMVAGQSYWKDSYLPAGVCAVITPMNFIYGIPGIQIVGCYLSGSPMIFKGHPFSAITSTTLTKMMIAAGADPRCSAQARRLRRRHLDAHDRPPRGRGEPHRQRRDGEDDSGRPRRSAGEVRRRRLQLGLRRRRVYRRRARSDRRAPLVLEAGARGRTSARASTASPRARPRSTGSSR